MKLFWKILLLLFIQIQMLFAGNIHIKKHSTAEGLSHKTIRSIYRDKEGFLWIGTTNGLSRFDGYNFKNFNLYDPKSQTLGSNIIQGITENKDGILFIATNSGLKYFDKYEEIFHSINLLDEDSGLISDLTIDSEDNIWVCHNSLGLFKIIKQNNTYISQHIAINKLLGFTKPFYIWKVCYFENEIWISSSNGLLKYDILNNNAIQIHYENEPAYCTSLRPGKEHEIILSVRDFGVYLINTKNSQYSIIEKNNFINRKLQL